MSEEQSRFDPTFIGGKEVGEPNDVRYSRRTVVASVIISVAVTLGLIAFMAFMLYAFRTEVFQSIAATYFGGSSALAQVGTQDLMEQESQVVSIVKRANPAVVSVVITKDVPVLERYYEEFRPFGGGSGFQIPRLRERGTEEREVGGGSGFIVSADGMVVTNKHVVEDEEATYTLLTNDGEKYDVEVIARDPVLDIAVLRIQGGGTFSYISFGDSDSLRLGQTAIAIGNALGEFRNSVSVGVISGLARSIVAGDQFGSQTEQLDDVIQTDAAINVGNSGGPLLDLHGDVIGMNVAVALGSENIGFALPSNSIQDIVQSVQQTGQIIRPFLGIRYGEITPQLAALEELSVEYGALVSSGEGEPAVVEGSPAAQAGIQEGDIILSLDGESLEEHSLASLIRSKAVGQTIPIEILRNGERTTLNVTLAQAP